MRERPVLIASPRDDDAFREFAERLVANGAAATKALEVALRIRYPKAVVRARDLAGERVVVWYVYREGRWTHSERLAEELMPKTSAELDLAARAQSD